ncbi:MAG: phosphoglycerate dehydrogenase [Planctomycetota bacterium]|nr:phosphoglycerate dehydrogenase [Planctomycetota bacterium]
MTYRVLVADDLAEDGLEILRQTAEVTVKKGMNEDALREQLPGYHGLVVRSATQVTARSLELVDELAVIGRAGIGIDNIDVDAATTRGIVVMNTPEAGAVTTGEHALALLLSMARKIPAADASVRSGSWEKGKFTGRELNRKQLGVLGLGRIGRVVAERGRGLGMLVAAYDPFVQQANAPQGVRMLTLEELLQTSDFVSVHVPLLDETRHLLSRERLLQMKPGSHLVHAARGGIVDERALCEVLAEGHLAGAAIDVFEQEPLAADSPLREAPNLILTPHLGASTHEAKHNVSTEIARQVATCLQQGIALNGINVPRIAPADAAQVGPYLELVHNLAAMLSQMFADPIVSLRLTVQGGLPESALGPLTTAMVTGALKSGSKAAVTPVNAERLAQERNIRVHSETSSLKRDFMNLVRVEALLGETRHFASGTVLGHRHGRLVELDDYVIDAIPEAPMLITLHSNRPGVAGSIGTQLGEFGINISRMQVGRPSDTASEDPSIAILNLDRPLDPQQLEAIRNLPAIQKAMQVQ